MLGPPIMSPVWYWAPQAVRYPAIVLERIKDNVVTLCVLPTDGNLAPYVVRDVPYKLEPTIYDDSVDPLWRGHIPNRHANVCWQYMQETEEKRVAQQTPAQDGYAMGTALRHMVGAGQASNQDVFSMGRRFATMAGYQSADSAFDYIEGFVNGYGDGAPKELAAPKESE